jgi:LemA protein
MIGERIARLRAVKRDHRDAIAYFAEQFFGAGVDYGVRCGRGHGFRPGIELLLSWFQFGTVIASVYFFQQNIAQRWHVARGLAAGRGAFADLQAERIHRSFKNKVAKKSVVTAMTAPRPACMLIVTTPPYGRVLVHIWRSFMRKILTVLAALASLSLTNCGYNAIQQNDESVKSAWSEVVNQYQRRADLVPNIVNSVKGFAQQEKDVLLGVTNARAKVGSINVTPEVLNDPAAFQKFQQAQGELSGALSRLLVTTEAYPTLKSDQLFRDLVAQLEGTENRITVARNRYIKAVQDYNVGIRTFPNNLTAMAFGYKEKANFTVDNEKSISTAPKVDFNVPSTTAPAPAPAAPAPAK